MGRKGPTPTILVPVLAAGADPATQDLDVLPAGPAVELVQPQLLTAHIVPSPRLVLHVDAEVHVLLGRQHLGRERGDSEPPWRPRHPAAGTTFTTESQSLLDAGSGPSISTSHNRPVCRRPATPSCLTRCGPKDCSPPGPSVCGISQAGIPE